MKQFITNLMALTLLTRTTSALLHRAPSALLAYNRYNDKSKLIIRPLQSVSSVGTSDAPNAKERKKIRRNQEIQRNFHLKTLDKSSSSNLIQIKVSACHSLRSALALNGREKRGRLFVPIDELTSYNSLKLKIHEFFRRLKKDTYYIAASLNVQDEYHLPTEESVSVLEHLNNNRIQYWNVTSDKDLLAMVDRAVKYFESKSDDLKRPSLVLHVIADEEALQNSLEEPPLPDYLLNLPDHRESKTMSMLSFYSFPPGGIENVEMFAAELRRQFTYFGALGRIYIAEEGVNAQMAVPTIVLEKFIECCNNFKELGEFMENGVNVDPVPLTMEEFSRAGNPKSTSSEKEDCPPFKNLHVRTRKQIVADGLDKSLDWQSAGYDMPPMEWHNKIKEMKERSEQGGGKSLEDMPILLDCRNDYETRVGAFVGAEPLDTVNFRDSWDVLKERLKDTPKDAPIMTYCTGGIRCVKVGAYLTQEMGFTNVSRLAGGIIAYDRTLNNVELSPDGRKEVVIKEESMFKGTNYVFDGRVGRKITDDDLGNCITCGAKTSGLSNCRNPACHKRMVQCPNCETAFLGTCSDSCMQRAKYGPTKLLKTSHSTTTVEEKMGQFKSLDEYSSAHTSKSPAVYLEIQKNTEHFLSTGSHMVSGSTQGRLLTSLSSFTRNGRILEVGTFTGYATSCFAEGALNVHKLLGYDGVGSIDEGPFVLSLERDIRSFEIASEHIKLVSSYGFGENCAEAASNLRDPSSSVIGTSPPSTKREELTSTSSVVDNAVGVEIRLVDDALATLEMMAFDYSDSISTTEAFDLVFLDADKGRLLEYVDVCVNSDKLLKKGGMILVDNVLWKGGVLNKEQDEDDSSEMSAYEIKRSRRARKLANVMHTFNEAIVKDDRLEVVMLPLRDGISILRKK